MLKPRVFYQVLLVAPRAKCRSRSSRVRLVSLTHDSSLRGAPESRAAEGERRLAAARFFSPSHYWE